MFIFIIVYFYFPFITVNRVAANKRTQSPARPFCIDFELSLSAEYHFGTADFSSFTFELLPFLRTRRPKSTKRQGHNHRFHFKSHIYTLHQFQHKVAGCIFHRNSEIVHVNYCDITLTSASLLSLQPLAVNTHSLSLQATFAKILDKYIYFKLFCHIDRKEVCMTDFAF